MGLYFRSGSGPILVTSWITDHCPQLGLGKTYYLRSHSLSKLKPIEFMSTHGKYPELNADRLTLSLMAMSAPIQILGRPEFQKIPPEQFHPFEIEVDELPTAVEIKEDTDIEPEILRFYKRCAAYEDAVCTICCTTPGAAGVTAVVVEYLERTSSSAGDKLLERIRTEVEQGLTKFQRIVVATNGRVSEEKKAYIIKALDTIQKIDFAMNLVELESRDDREKAEGQKTISNLFNFMLDLVLENCREKIEARFYGRQSPKRKLLKMLCTYLYEQRLKPPFDPNLKYTPPSYLNLPLYSQSSHERWMSIVATNLKSLLSDILEYRSQTLQHLRQMLLSAHTLRHLPPSTIFLNHLDNEFTRCLPQTANFSIKSYLSKVSSHIEAVRRLCFYPWAGYIFDYCRMDVQFLIPNIQSYQLPWTELKTEIALRGQLQKVYGGVYPQRRPITFSKGECKTLERRWTEKHVQEVPLHAEMQLFKHVVESRCETRSGYIASSKSCCYLCMEFLRNWNYFVCEMWEESHGGDELLRWLPYFNISGTHGKCYHRWQFPAIKTSQNRYGELIRPLLAKIYICLKGTLLYHPTCPQELAGLKLYNLALAMDSIPLLSLDQQRRLNEDLTKNLEQFEEEGGAIFSCLDM